MKLETSDLQRLYKEIAHNQVKHFYHQYKQYFKSISFDEKDIVQEMYLLILELYKSYPESDEETFEKILYTAVKYKLCNLVDSAITSKLKLTPEQISIELDKMFKQEKIGQMTYDIGIDFYVNCLSRDDIIKKYNKKVQWADGTKTFTSRDLRNVFRVLRIDLATKYNFMRLTRLTSSEISYAAENSESIPCSIKDNILSTEATQLDDIEVQDMLNIIKDRLSERDYNVFCDKVLEDMTNEQLQQKYDITRERVRQILEKVRLIFSKKVLTKSKSSV